MGFAFLLLFLIKPLRQERRFFFIPTFRFERIVRSFSAFGRKGIGTFSSNYFPFPALELILAIISNDSKKIQKAPGLGKKSAERLIVELRDKVPKEEITFSGEEAVVTTTASVAVEEAVEALVSLGYSAIEAKRWITKIPNYEEKSAEDLLRLSLKQFAL